MKCLLGSSLQGGWLEFWHHCSCFGIRYSEVRGNSLASEEEIIFSIHDFEKGCKILEATALDKHCKHKLGESKCSGLVVNCRPSPAQECGVS